MTGPLADPAELARYTRERLHVGGRSPLPDILRLVEDDGVNVAILQIPDGPDGLYLVERGVPFVLVNGTAHPVRQRFTLAHEYGHHLLGHGAKCDEALTLSPMEPKEQAANAFAAEFLLPIAAVTAWLADRGRPEANLETLVELASAFGVSARMTLYRLDAAATIGSATRKKALEAALDAGEHRELFRCTGSRVADTIQEAWRAPARMPRRMRENLLKAYSLGLLSLEQVADRLLLDVPTLQAQLAEADADAADGAA